jgi:hypothetical protein
MSQFTQKEILDKITAALATVIRIDPRIIADLRLTVSMNEEINGMSLGDSVFSAAELLANRKGQERISEAILKYGKVNASLADFYMSVFRGLDEMPNTEYKAEKREISPERELKALELLGTKRALSKFSNGVFPHYSR